MMRIGIDERSIGVMVRTDSPADRAISAVSAEMPAFAEMLKDAYNSNLKQPARGDLGFFRMMLERRI